MVSVFSGMIFKFAVLNEGEVFFGGIYTIKSHNHHNSNEFFINERRYFGNVTLKPILNKIKLLIYKNKTL